MESAFQIFSSPEFGIVRTAGTPEDPRFCLTDVCKILELDASAVMRRLDDGVISSHLIPDSLGRMQKTNFVNEDGLYDVILDSRKPEARRFRKWITSEVIPQIRRTGSYSLQKTNYRELLRNRNFVNDLVLALQEEQEKVEVLTQENAALTQQVEELTPKATYYDVILNCQSPVAVTIIAKDYGLSAKKFNRLLNKLKVQFNVGGTWVLYGTYAARGWTVSKTIQFNHKDGTPDCHVATYWTQRGRAGLYELLKRNGHLPQIELEQLLQEKGCLVPAEFNTK